MTAAVNRFRWPASIVFALLLAGSAAACSTSEPANQIDLTTVIRYAANDSVKQIQIDGEQVRVELKDGEVYFSKKESATSLVDILRRNNVDPATIPITVQDSDPLSGWLNAGLQMLPILLFAGFLLLIMGGRRGASSQAISFTKSGARLTSSGATHVTFEDVAGIDEAKQDLQEIVDFLKNPEKYRALGAHIPRGVLLLGPPGTGKTLLARAVAGEAGVPFFAISGSEFVEMFVGVGAARVRDLFTKAKESAPSIIFIDEIDAVGRQRGAGIGWSNDEREQTLNQVLVEMDGFETNTNVIVLAATNRPDILDVALLRPGRFDRQVIIDSPDVKGRKEILDIHLTGKPLAPDVLVETIAKRTPAFSGADLANIVNEAAILAARAGKHEIGMSEFEEAIDRVTLGPDRKSRVRSAQENETIAYHEAGHALVAYYLRNFDPLFKVTIVPRGIAAGSTMVLPDEDRHVLGESYLENELAMILGGHVAEELVFNEASTGARDDIEKATHLAVAMVTRFGMSQELGPRTFAQSNNILFGSLEMGGGHDYSEKLGNKIDKEVRHFLVRAHETAKAALSAHRPKLDELAKKLIEVESLQGQELLDLLAAP